MNVVEGARRMRRSGRIITLLAAFLYFSLLCVYAGYSNLTHLVGLGTMTDEVIRYVIMGVARIAEFAILPGALLWLASWILEGFSQDDPSSADRPKLSNSDGPI